MLSTSKDTAATDVATALSRARLEDVARAAGVGVGTVSRVINNRPSVSKSTRTKVEQAIKRLRYSPNLHASMLASGNSKTLGVILSNLSNPFFADVYYSIETSARQHGYELVISNTRHDLSILRASIRRMLGLRVGGLAVMVSETDPAILEILKNAQIPVALFDVGALDGDLITTIHFDYCRGMRMLIEQLYALGHRKLIYVNSPKPSTVTDERLNEFVKATAARSLETRVLMVELDGFEGGREATRQILNSHFMPTAIVCVNDWFAVGALRELHTRGIDVPGQISVTGFDNVSMSEFTCPSLTTVTIPRKTLGHVVFSAIMKEQVQGRPRTILIDPELVVRESTGLAQRRSQ